MILNRTNPKKTNKKKEIKNSNVEEEENEEEEEEIEEKEDSHKIKKQKNKKHKKKEKEENEEEEEIGEEKDFRKMKKQKNKKHKHVELYEEEEQEEEEEDSDDKIKSRQKREKMEIPKNKIALIVIISLIIIILLMIIILLVKRNKNTDEELSNINSIQQNNSGLSSSNNNNNSTSPSAQNNQNQPNEENKEENKENKDSNLDKDNINKEMKEKYEQDGYLNINKFWKENVLKQEYKTEEYLQKPNQIHINIGFTDININTYIKHIASILHKAEQDKTYLHLHMMDAGELNVDTLKKLFTMVNNINNSTEIIVYNANPALKEFNIQADKLDKFATDYAKLYALKILKDIKKIIFLDADDIMVQKDLAELYELKMDDLYARGIAEEPSLKGSMEWYDEYILDKSHYINGGVMLINLELCQRDNLYSKAVELNNNNLYTKSECPMQDILNVLMRKKIEFFHPKFNKINFYENPVDRDNESKWYDYMQQTLKLGEKNNHLYTKEELLEADENPVIIHYYWDKALEKVIVKYEEDKKEYAKLCELNE